MAKINIDIDSELHRKVRLISLKKGVTLIQFVNEALSERVMKK